MQTHTIYVPLINEGTDVWRPVTAESVSDALFRIISHEPEGEEWVYGSGQVVAVQQRRWADGNQGLAAFQAAPQARIDVSTEELRIINNALNEICNGLDLGTEFETRIGASLIETLTLLQRLSARLA